MAQPIIRVASVADAERLALVGTATFLETFADVLDGDAIVAHCERQHRPDSYRALLASGATGWLAESSSGRAPVGYALLTKPDLAAAHADGRDVELKRIYVLSKFHGGGVGLELMNSAVDAAKAGGAERLLLGVYHLNHRALAFYARHGFEQIATRRFQVGDRAYDDLVLALTLTPP